MINFMRRILGNGEKIAIGNKICIGLMLFFYIIIPVIALLGARGYQDIELSKQNELSELKDDLFSLKSDNETAIIRKEVEALQARLNEVQQNYEPYHVALENERKAERAEREAKAKATALKRAAEAKLKEDFKLQFSVWNGSHNKTVKYVKERMHNPKSFKHVETSYMDYAEKGFRIIHMKYRGTNLYNAVVTNSIWVKVDLEGNVTEVMKNE